MADSSAFSGPRATIWGGYTQPHADPPFAFGGLLEERGGAVTGGAGLTHSSVQEF